MPNSQNFRTRRQDAIRKLLKAGPAHTQQTLVGALQSLGLAVTQSSVSRDLREIGALKTSAGYELPRQELTGDQEVQQVSNLLRSLSPAGPNLLVIKTAIGAAQRVALALVRSNWPEIVGNVGGDDTVFTATISAVGQRNLLARIDRAMARS